ncbi:alanine racemase [Acetobacter cibinongensis]|uniref:Alanine racemase n=1 Tax=Acetobacter cibinongensis TaxID=146475 RepID=A0A1Z5YRW0_9PROT|nr:alanine racemase [Acetobacter cibinongensis]OUJ00010.1 alanine racemase [Acetobacter cibinongensis]
MSSFLATSWPASRAGAVLTVDLAAIAANYRLLAEKVGTATCAAVVKADAYGLGAAHVAPVLEQAGAREFFVAHVDEGLALKAFVSPQVRITVLHGARPNALKDCMAAGLRPVLNSLEQVAQLQAFARQTGQTQDAVLQLDTGMSRFGLSGQDVKRLADIPSLLEGISLSLIMSHLACADTPDNDANAQQLERLVAYAALLPKAPLSLAASSGIFIGDAFHRNLVRPGAALYGVAPNQTQPNPLRPVVRLQAHVLQTRTLSKGDRVGYGLSWQAEGPCRVATLATGYADGFARQGAATGCAWFNGHRLPILGRISMDSMTVDVSALSEETLGADTLVDLLNDQYGVDDVAAAEGTIGYEVLTSLGRRYHRVYQNTPSLS